MRTLLVLTFLALGSACSPADVAGEYTISITNRTNGCAFDNWKENEMTSAVPFEITQNGSAITGQAKGLIGGYLDLVLGSHTFTGSVGGNNLTMTLQGTRSASKGNCAYTVNSTVNAVSSGDALSGTISYTAVTNKNSDCGSLNECTTRQDFNGTRPPQ